MKCSITAILCILAYLNTTTVTADLVTSGHQEPKAMLNLITPDDGADQVSNCSEPSSINFQAGRVYLIQSSADDTVVDLKDSLTKQKNPIITYPRHLGKNQLWTARASQASNSFNLISMVPGTLSGALTYDAREGYTLIRFLSDGSSQQWYVGKQCGMSVQIRSNLRNSNSQDNCLAKTRTGEPLEVLKCDELDSNQLWQLNFV